MPEVKIEQQPSLDLLDMSEPKTSATSDMPVVETKPDFKPPLEATKPEAKDAAPDEGKKPEESAPPEKPDEDAAASDEPKKAKGVQKRIDELVRQREDAERRAEEERQEKLRLLALVESKDKPKAEPQPAEDEDPEPQEPTKANFQNPDEYDAALRKWSREYASWTAKRQVESVLADREKQEQARQIEEGQKTAREAYLARIEKVTEKYPDYKQVAESPDVTVSIPMAHAIMHSEHGPEIQYHLGKNPEEAKRISALNPVQQLMEIGLIVARFTEPAKAEPKAEPTKPVVSAAPKPIKPLESKSEPAPKSPNEMSMDEYAAYVEKRDKPARASARH